MSPIALFSLGTRRWFLVVASLLLPVTFASILEVGCGSGPTNGAGGGGGDSDGGSGDGSNGGPSGADGNSADGGTVQCPSGAQCSVPCPGGGTTSISGKVYDPALKNGIYNVEVYVPGGALQALPKGVPQGADACNCRAHFKSGAVVSTVTGTDGSFTLTNAPVGQQIPLVLQVGKWRRVVHVDTTQCSDAPQPDKSLSLPGTVAPGSDDNMPDIAVSTGHADTLECLMKRIGLPDSEYVAGTASTGHVHVFSGGAPDGGGIGGSPESPPMPGAPVSATDLWDAPAHLMPYDILLLSCEGAETYNANPAALEEYLNAGGRTFASHYHYAWFTGSSLGPNTYAPPADWGNALATWSGAGGSSRFPTNGQIVQTLNGSTNPFPKGVALDQWLGHNGALGVQDAAPQGLTIFNAHPNSIVGPDNKPSQPWIQENSLRYTMLFSFDTPVNASVDPATGVPSYCGRGVFGGLHAAGTYNPVTHDTSPPPGGCQATDLSPQEKVLEFMLFDLSSCVIPDSVAPPDGGILGP
jgi:hypothetical protein